MEHAYDAVVVGSGFGGGISACRLAEAGTVLSSIVLLTKAPLTLAELPGAFRTVFVR